MSGLSTANEQRRVILANMYRRQIEGLTEMTLIALMDTHRDEDGKWVRVTSETDTSLLFAEIKKMFVVKPEGAAT